MPKPEYRRNIGGAPINVFHWRIIGATPSAPTMKSALLRSWRNLAAPIYANVWRTFGATAQPKLLSPHQVVELTIMEAGKFGAGL
jgi:hypothetical protein